MSSSRWAVWRAALVRGVRKAKERPRRALVVVLTMALVATGGVVTSTGVPVPFPDIVSWLESLFGSESFGPTAPPVAEATTPDADTDELGLEDFYQYAALPSGTGSQTMVNLHTGNAIFGYDAFANPSRGHATFARITYNSLDRDDSSMGLGWSLSATTLTRLGTPLAFHPPGQTWPSEVTLVDGDGTRHVFRLNKHDSQDESAWDYDHPAGVHLLLQKNAGADPARSWVMTKPDRTRFFFDDKGYQSAIADRNGNELRFAYAERMSNNKPTKFLQEVTDPAGRRTLSVTYFAKGDTYTFIDDDGNPVTQDDLTNPHIIERVRSITDVDGRRMEFTYTDKGLLAQLIDGAGTPLAKTYSFGYDVAQATPNTRLVKVTDPRGNATRMSYFDAPTNSKFKGWVQSMTDRLGATTTFDYEDPDGPRSTTLHVTVTDPQSHATQYLLDGKGRPVKATDAKGQSTELGWDADNNLVQLREPNGAKTTAIYDSNTGLPVEVGDAEANEHQTAPTKLTYRTELNGHVADLATSTSPEGRTWTLRYDAVGNLVSATDPAGTASPTDGDFTTTYAYDSAGQLLKGTDANGHTTTYGDYDPNGLPRSVTDSLGHTTTMAYDARGGVVSVTDARGRTTTATFDLFGRPLESRAPKNAAAGEFIVTPAPVYDANDNITATSAPNGARSTESYDAADQVIASFAPKDTPDGPDRKTTYTYDKMGNLTAVTEPNGNLTPDNPNDFVTRYTYDEIYQTTAVTNARAGVTSYGYDNAGNLTVEVDPLKNATADPADYTTKFTYDLNHRARTATDAAGFTASADYDRDGLVIATTDEAGTKTLLAYDPRGLLTETRTPHDTVNGAITYHTTRYEYDQVGNRTKVVSPRGVATTDDPDDFAQVTVYDELDRVKEQILPFDKKDPLYKVPEKIVNSYDEVGNLVKVSMPPSGLRPGEPGGLRVDATYTHFDNGWIASSTDAFNRVTRYTYDDIGRQTSRTLTGADGDWTHRMDWTYYPDGKLRSKSDPGVPFGSNVVVMDNSDPSLIVKEVGFWPSTNAGSGFFGTDYQTHEAGTHFDYFTWSPEVNIEGTYDIFVRYPSVPGAATNARFSFTGGGVKIVDQTQHTNEWVSLGRADLARDKPAPLVQLSAEANGTVVADAVMFVRDNSQDVDNEFQSFSYVYDANGNLTSLNDASSDAVITGYAMAYTGLNQLARMDQLAAGSVAHTTSYTYDANGNRTSRVHDGRIDMFEFDTRNLLSKVTNAVSANDLTAKVATYEYTGRAQLARETKGSGTATDYTYFADGLLRHQLQAGGSNNATVIAEHTLEYDLNGNRVKDLSRLMNADNRGAFINHDFSYRYDPRGRIVDVTDATRAEEHYTYDANSNILEQNLKVTTGAPAEQKNVTTTFTYDRNRLQTSKTVGSTGAGEVKGASTFFYDPFGRTTELESIDGPTVSFTDYRYDGFDRKTSQVVDNVRTISQRSRFTYDPFNRVTRTVNSVLTADNQTKTSTTNYQYLGAGDLVLSSDVTTDNTTVVNAYQYGPDGQRLSQTRTGDDGVGSLDLFYSYNPHGDVEAITEADGLTVATYGYTAYGQDDPQSFTGVDKPDPANPAKLPVNQYRFNAKQWDPVSATYDMGFRDYSPAASRFLTPDVYSAALADLRLGTSPGNANRYAFAGGDPINRIELDGHCWSWLQGVCDAVSGYVDGAINGTLYPARMWLSNLYGAAAGIACPSTVGYENASACNGINDAVTQDIDRRLQVHVPLGGNPDSMTYKVANIVGEIVGIPLPAGTIAAGRRLLARLAMRGSIEVAETAETRLPSVLGSGGRRGSSATRAQNQRLIESYSAGNPHLEHVGGGFSVAGRKLPELHFGPRLGGSFADISFRTPTGGFVHIQTVDMIKSLGVPTIREAWNANRLARQSGGIVIMHPKTGSGSGIWIVLPPR